MKKLLLVLAVVVLPTLLCASGFFYNNPTTMRYDTSFGLLEGNWDMILRNPAQLSLIKGAEFYTLFNQSGAGYDEFEIAFRKYFSEKSGSISVYFSKMIYNYGDYEDETDATFTDIDSDGISDEKDIFFESDDYIEREDEYKLLINYGKEFTEKLRLGLGLALYLDDYTESWNEIDEYIRYDLHTGDVLQTLNAIDEGEYETKKSEFDLNIGSIYTMDKDISIEGVFSYNSIKNGENLNDITYTYNYRQITGYQELYTGKETGSDISSIWDNSPYSGSGLGFNIKINYDKLKDHKFSLDLFYKNVNADVADGTYNYDEQYKELIPNASLIETYTEKETNDITRTGTGVKNGNLGLFLRYYRPFNDKVKFSAGIKCVPMDKTTIDYTQDYKYNYREDFNDGDSVANDSDDWHYTETYSNSKRVKEIYEGNIISFPIAVEIRKSDVLVWRAGVEHYIANYRDTWEYELLTETKTEYHSWDDGGSESWWSDTTPGNYHYGDKDSETSTDQTTDFKLGLCYTPVKNLHIDARFTLKDIEMSLNPAEIGFSVRYLF